MIHRDVKLLYNPPQLTQSCSTVLYSNNYLSFMMHWNSFWYFEDSVADIHSITRFKRLSDRQQYTHSFTSDALKPR